jgi:hypothetical protein
MKQRGLEAGAGRQPALEDPKQPDPGDAKAGSGGIARYRPPTASTYVMAR